MNSTTTNDPGASRRRRLISSIMTPLLAMMITLPEVAPAHEDVSFEGLKPVEHARVEKAFIDPSADFSQYKRVKILTPYIAFQKNWRRDQNRDRLRRISAHDMERMKKEIAALFEKTFIAALEAKDGYPVVQESSEDVLLLRPAIIDLDVAVPDTMDPQRGSSYSASAGAATLYVELFDSTSGKIIGRAIDRRAIRSAGSTIAWTNKATNAADGRRLFRRWADLLRDFLDRHYTGQPGSKPGPDPTTD